MDKLFSLETRELETSKVSEDATVRKKIAKHLEFKGRETSA